MGGRGSQGQHKLCSGAVRKSKSAQVHTLQVQEGKYPKSHFEGLSGQHKSCFGALTKRTKFKFTTGMAVMCMANILDYTKSVQIFWIAQHFIIIFGSRGSSERKTRNFLFGVSKSFTKKEFCNFVQVLVQVQVQVLECGELEISSGYLTCCPFVLQLV